MFPEEYVFLMSGYYVGLFYLTLYRIPYRINIMQKEVILEIVLLFYVSLCFGQKNDTLVVSKNRSADFQEFRINSTLIYQYQKPKFFEFVTKIPNSIAILGDQFIQKDNLIWFGSSIGATAALVPFDQNMVDSSRDFGQKIGFNESHNYSGPVKMFPKDLNSAIYRFGNGFTAILIGGGLLTYGLKNNDYRAVQTSSEIMEGLIVSGFFVQTVKRITGRESPFIAEENGNKNGKWTLFPSFSAYARNTPNYDAMPSGHLVSILTTVVIISENYKEIKWIKPVSYGFIGLMCFEMTQSKVHWVSDYPLALFMGYIIGKSIVKSRIDERKELKIGYSKFVKPKLNYTFSTTQNYTLAGIRIIF